MVSIETKIFESIKTAGRGSIIFPSDFAAFADVKTVGKSLERLTNKGSLVRLARGVYYYPIIDTELGLGIMMPSIDEIASKIAQRDRARIAPAGDYALNKLGLSTQVPMNFVYLTDGSNRVINLEGGHSIQFIRTTPKNLSFNNQLAALITVSLKEIGAHNLTEEIVYQIQQILKRESYNNMKQDIPLMPAWIQTIIKQAYA